jgi:hypothetical protein
LGSHHTIGVSRKGSQCPRAVWSVRNTAIGVLHPHEGSNTTTTRGLQRATPINRGGQLPKGKAFQGGRPAPRGGDAACCALPAAPREGLALSQILPSPLGDVPYGVPGRGVERVEPPQHCALARQLGGTRRRTGEAPLAAPGGGLCGPLADG